MRNAHAIATHAALLMALAACSQGDASQAAAPPEEAGPAAPPTLSVRGVSGQYDLGDYRVMGEVVNLSETAVHDVEIALRFLDAGGRELTTGEAATALVRLEPRGTAPFLDLHYGAPEGIARVEASVRRAVTETLLPHHALRVAGVHARTGVSGVIVTGRLHNDGDQPLRSIKLVTSFRDGDGNVAGVHFDYPVTGTLSAGDSVDFTVETFDETLSGLTPVVQAEGAGVS